LFPFGLLLVAESTRSQLWTAYHKWIHLQEKNEMFLKNILLPANEILATL